MKESRVTSSSITFLYRSLIFGPRKEFNRIIKTAIVIGDRFFSAREKHDLADIGDYIFVHRPFNHHDAEKIARESEWYGGSKVDSQFLAHRYLGDNHQPKTTFSSSDLS